MTMNVFVGRVLLALALSLIGFVSPLGAQEAAFTDLQDLVPDRCFSAPLSTVGPDSVDIGIESGVNSSWIDKACVASTTPFHGRIVNDTFTATVTAPPGMRIGRIHYEQQGTRYLERSTYWSANGTGTLTVNGVAQPFGFTSPTLVQTVDLAGQDVQIATVSVNVRLEAKRNSAFPRVTDAPGSATISVTNAVIRVELRPAPPGCAGWRLPGRDADV